MRFLHSMVRVSNLDASLKFFCEGLGLKETRRKEVESGRFTLVFLATKEGAPEIELTWNWDHKDGYSNGRNFGHLAYAVEDIYHLCERLEGLGYPILRPPREGRMAFVKSPDGISVELLQKGEALAPKEPWSSRENQGEW